MNQEAEAKKPGVSPKDFFLHLAAMAALYVSASSLLALLYQIINVSFPDSLDSTSYIYSYNPYSAIIRWAIASLIIVFPIYIVLTRILNKDYAANPEKRGLGVRKWLTYLTLFFAGSIIAGDLIFLLNTFLAGEITGRFILKSLSVFAVSAIIFGYYLRDIRSEKVLSEKERGVFKYGTIVLVAASVIGGFLIMGSPVNQRALRFDQDRVSSLENIEWQVVQYWQQKQQLPDSLADINDSLNGYRTPADPETMKAYEYAKTGDLSFELCADFSLDSSKENSNGSMVVMYQDQGDNWDHGVGRTCFKRTIDPDKYPPLNKPMM